MQLSATEAKSRLSELMAEAGDEAVIITRYGRPEVAMISARRFKELEAMEDRYRSLLAPKSEKKDKH